MADAERPTQATTLSGAFAEGREQRSGMKRAGRMLRRNRLGVIGMAILLVVAAAAVFSPVLAPYGPNEGDIIDRLKCPMFTSCSATGQEVQGTSEHVLGTDALGRDILSRIIYGARVSLIVGLTAVLLGAGVGSTLGLLSGYYGGFVDSVIMRIGDLFLAFPYLLLAIAIVAVLGGGLLNVIIVLAIATWVPYARLMRGSVLSAKEREYIVAAQAIGVRDGTLLFKHVLPNVVTPIIVFGTFSVVFESPEFIPQKNGEKEVCAKPVAFRPQQTEIIQAYRCRGGLSQFLLDDVNGQLPEAVQRQYVETLRCIGTTIKEGPVVMRG